MFLSSAFEDLTNCMNLRIHTDGKYLKKACVCIEHVQTFFLVIVP
jgi:hypothetical protein